MRYRGFNITYTTDKGVERENPATHRKDIRNGYYCEIYPGDDDQYANRIERAEPRQTRCILAVVIDNYFLIPVFAVAFAALPFFVARSTISAYDKHIKEEMETALSIITTSYIRSDDIVAAVQENIPQLKPPIREIFQGFVGETMMISSNMKDALRNLKDKIDNDIYAEWCDTLIACQDDRTLKDTLLPIVAKLTDVRIVNNELKTLLGEVKKEYWMMVCLVVCNIPLLYVLNKDWYDALMFTLPGKIVLAICGVVILITAVLMMKYTRPVEYKR